MKRYILTCFCIGMLFHSVYAQLGQDSIVKVKAEADALDAAMRKRADSDTANQVKFNALHHSMQKRYLPKGAQFVNEKLLDNVFVGFWGGYNRIAPRSGVELSGGTEIGMSVSKLFTPLSGVRLSGSWSTATRESDNESWSSYGVSADHLFNLSSLFGGYNAHRAFEISTVEGVGVHLSSLAGQRKAAADFHLGMQFKLSTGTRLDLFAEPRFAFYTDGIDLSGEQNWHGYDGGFSGIFGLNYRLGTYYQRGSEDGGNETFLENTFISAGMGMQFQNSEMVRNQGILGSTGPIFHLSVGKWLLDSFGFRLSAFGSYNAWNRQNKSGMDYLAMYAGGRAEVMVNPFAFFRKDTRDMRWSIIPMLGVELGMMKKQDSKEMISRAYTGLTGGVQLKYAVSDNFAFYVEPRMSSVPYSFSEKTTSGRVNEYSFVDHLFNASIGIELRRPTRTQWKRLAALRGEFEPYYYTSFGAGLTMPQQVHRSASRRFGYLLSAAAGRQFNPVSGLRLGVDLSNAATHTNYGTNRYSFASFSLDYMFDISNVVVGYDPERKFGAEILAGPVISRSFDPGKTYFGVEGGVRAYWRLLDQFDIYAEPKVRLYTKRYMPAKAGTGTPLQLSFAMGTSYRFGSSYTKASAASGFGDGTFLGNTFVSASTGFQYLAASGRNIGTLVSSGPVVNLSVGKWLLPFWGLRVSAFGGYSAWGRVKQEAGVESDRLTARLGGRIESMIDVLAFGKEDAGEQRWGLIPMLGLEFGKVDKQNANNKVGSMVKSYTGVTAAIQCKYYFLDNVGLFVEPRFSRTPYSYTGTQGLERGRRISAVDNVMSFNLGIEFRRASQRELKSLASFKGEFTPYYFASFHTGLSMAMSRARYTSRKLGFLVGGTVGRQFLPCSGIRLGVDYSSLPGNGVNADSHSFANLSLDYLLDITNFMGGYNPDRRFGTEVLVGPVLSFGSEPNNTCLGGEVGLRAYYKLVKGFDIYAEPKFRVYTKDLLIGASVTPAQMMFSLGTSYKF